MKRLLALFVMLFVFSMSEGANAGNPTNLVGTWSGSFEYASIQDGYQGTWNVVCNITEQQGKLFLGTFDGRDMVGTINGRTINIVTDAHALSGSKKGKKIGYIIHSNPSNGSFNWIGVGEMILTTNP